MLRSVIWMMFSKTSCVRCIHFAYELQSLSFYLFFLCESRFFFRLFILREHTLSGRERVNFSDLITRLAYQRKINCIRSVLQEIIGFSTIKLDLKLKSHHSDNMKRMEEYMCICAHCNCIGWLDSVKGKFMLSTEFRLRDTHTLHTHTLLPFGFKSIKLVRTTNSRPYAWFKCNAISSPFIWFEWIL